MTHRLSSTKPTLTAAAWLVVMIVAKGGGGEGEKREERGERGNEGKVEKKNECGEELKKGNKERNKDVLETRSAQLYAHLLVHSKECPRAPMQLRLH